MEEKLTNKSFWNSYWQEETRDYDFMFEDIINQFIDWNKVSSYMEIGGAPGTIMAYMSKVHNLEVSTVDFCDRNIIDATMKNRLVSNYTVYEMDFDSYRHSKKYDIVASWGFIEHFDLNTVSKFISKQKMMVSPNGYLILELPNIKGLNYLLYRLLKPSLLKIHNLDVMNLDLLKSKIEDCNFKILYGNYYLTSFFEYNISNQFFYNHVWIKRIFIIIKKIARLFRLNNIPNKFLSPYIVFIAKREKSEKE